MAAAARRSGFCRDCSPDAGHSAHSAVPACPGRSRHGHRAFPRALRGTGVGELLLLLRGASNSEELATRAWNLGYDAIGIADANTMAGVVRIHRDTKALKLRPVIGCRIETIEGLDFLAYPKDRAAYGRLCKLITAGRRWTLGRYVAGQGRLRHLARHADGT